MNKNIVINKDIMINDLFTIMDLVRKGSLSEESYYAILEKYAWYLTEREFIDNHNYPAKYKGCPNWSKKALDKYSENHTCTGLRHEHVIPKKLFINSMKGLLSKPISEKEIDNYADQIKEKYIACVVTVGEAEDLDERYKDSMPSGETDFFKIKIKDIWTRYDECNIDHQKVLWEKTGEKQTRWKQREEI